MNPSTSCDRLWRKRLNELSTVWPELVAGRTTGLHKTRVATRRIREALPVVGAAAPAGKVRKLHKRIRALTRYLGPIRELDVELTLLDDSRAEKVSGRAIEMVRRQVASKRQALRDELAENAPVADLKKLLKKLERVAKKSATNEGQWRSVLATRLVRRAKALETAVEDAGPLYAPERLHDVRIATKKLRYALEIAHEARIAGAAPHVRALKRHQERLGRLHDLQTLLKRVRAAEASPSVGSRVNDLARYADMLERDCRRLHAGFVDNRDELLSLVTHVKRQIVPTLTTPERRQARVVGAKPTTVRARAAAR